MNVMNLLFHSFPTFFPGLSVLEAIVARPFRSHCSLLSSAQAAFFAQRTPTIPSPLLSAIEREGLFRGWGFSIPSFLRNFLHDRYQLNLQNNKALRNYHRPQGRQCLDTVAHPQRSSQKLAI